MWVLTITDEATGWPEIITIKNKRAELISLIVSIYFFVDILDRLIASTIMEDNLTEQDSKNYTITTA